MSTAHAMSDFRDDVSEASTPLSPNDEYIDQPLQSNNTQERLVLRLGLKPRAESIASDDVDMIDSASIASKRSASGPRAAAGARSASKKNYQEVDSGDDEVCLFVCFIKLCAVKFSSLEGC